MHIICTLTFELPGLAKTGLPLLAFVVLLYGWGHRRHRVSTGRGQLLGHPGTGGGRPGQPSSVSPHPHRNVEVV